MYLGNNLCGSGPGGPAVWVVDMCYDTTHGEGVVWIPPQGIPQYDGTETSEGGWTVHQWRQITNQVGGYCSKRNLKDGA